MPFAYQDARTRLPLLLETAGFEKVRLGRHEKILSCSSTEDFVLRIIDTPPIAPAIAAGGPEARGKIVDDVAASLSRYTLPDGTLSLPMATFVVEGRSPRT